MMTLKELRLDTLKKMRVSKWPHPSKSTQITGIVYGFALVLDGMIIILSLGHYMSNFAMRLSWYRGYSSLIAAKKALQKNIEKESENE